MKMLVGYVNILIILRGVVLRCCNPEERWYIDVRKKVTEILKY
jgi:hypothetical protein